MSGLLKNIASRFKLSRNDSAESPITDPTSERTTSDNQSTAQLPTNEEYVSVEVNQNGDPVTPDAEEDITKEEMANFFSESKKGRKNVILENENGPTSSAAKTGTGDYSKVLTNSQHNLQQQQRQSEQPERTKVVVARDRIEYKWYDILKFRPFRRAGGNPIRDNQPHGEGAERSEKSSGEWHIQTRRKRERKESLAGNV